MSNKDTKTALITGANHGIGKAISLELALRGFNVVISYLDTSDYEYSSSDTEMLHTFGGKAEAKRVASEIASSGGKTAMVGADLSRPESAEVLFREAAATFGKVDVLVNNAAHAETPDALCTVSAETIDRTFSVNSRAPVLLVREFVKQYVYNSLTSGAVVNVSTDGADCFPGQISYGASKASLESLTRSLAVELGGYGIRVNAVAPGPVHTGIPESYITPELEKELIRKIPLGRCGVPSDIAHAVAFLVSEEAAWITGQVIAVDGGHSLGRRF